MIFKLFTSPLIYLAFILHGHCSAFFSVNQAKLTTQSLSFDSNMQESFDTVNSEGFGMELGYFLTNSLAIEVGIIASEFSRVKFGGTTPNVYSAKIEPNLNILTGGVRIFMYDFFNIRLGGYKSEYDPNLRSTGALDQNDFGKDSDFGNYYGVGVGMTFSKFQIFFDQTNFSFTSKKDTQSQQLGLRIFI